MNPAPHLPHLVSPEKKARGLRVLTMLVPVESVRLVSACRCFAEAHRASSTILSSGTSFVPHSEGGFARDTRRPVSGSLMYRSRFHTRRPTYNSLLRIPVPRTELP